MREIKEILNPLQDFLAIDMVRRVESYKCQQKSFKKPTYKNRAIPVNTSPTYSSYTKHFKNIA